MSTSTSTSPSTTPSLSPTSTSISSMEKTHIAAVLKKLEWMRANKIWPNGLRYLWTDAHGIILLVSLYRATGDRSYLDQAEQVVRDVKRVLGRSPGFRIGEEPDRDGQYFHYLTKWIFSMICLHTALPNSTYRKDTIDMVRAIHPRFIRRGVGVIWKMKEDLSGPYHGYGLGGLDHYDGYVMYRLLDNGEGVLRREILDMYDLIRTTYEEFECRQDLGLGEILWLGHFFPNEEWSKHTRKVALDTLDKMWVDIDGKRGYFRRDRYGSARTIIAFANHGVCYGLQSVGAWPERVENMLRFFEDYRSGDEYDYNAITHVMHCNALYLGIMLLNAEELAHEQHTTSSSSSAPISMKKEKEEEKQQEKIKEEAIRIAQEHKA